MNFLKANKDRIKQRNDEEIKEFFNKMIPSEFKSQFMEIAEKIRPCLLEECKKLKNADFDNVQDFSLNYNIFAINYKRLIIAVSSELKLNEEKYKKKTPLDGESRGA